MAGMGPAAAIALRPLRAVRRYSPEWPPIDGSAAVGFVRGGGSTAIPLSFVRREPLLKPKTTLNGSDAERIDTRIVEVLFELGRSEIDVVPGQLLDILIETEAP